MSKVFSERDAKEYLVSKVVEEAQRRRVRLSEIERRMLFFSETGWSLPDIVDVVGQFEQRHNAARFERKIVRLIKGARERADSNEDRLWNEASKCLARGDHYLGVLIDRAAGASTGDVPWRVWVAASALIGGGFVLSMSVEWYLGRTARRDDLAFFAWVALLVAAMVYTLLRGIFGARAVDGLIDRVIEKVWPVRRP